MLLRRAEGGLRNGDGDELWVAVGGSGEAKAKDDPVNRVQVAIQTKFARHVFPDHPCRPVTVKLFEDGWILFMEFNVTDEANALVVVRHRYFRVIEKSG